MRWVLRVLGIVILAAASLYAFVFLVLISAESAVTTHRIETREVHPDYVFALCTISHQFDGQWKEFREVRFAEITPDGPLILELDGWPVDGSKEFKMRIQARLTIVSRAVAAQYKTAAEYDEAGVPSGEGKSFGWATPVPPWHDIDKRVTVTHRVQRKQSGDGLEVVRTSWSPLWQWSAVGIPLLVAMLVGGFLLVRRAFRYTSPPAA